MRTLQTVSPPSLSEDMENYPACWGSSDCLLNNFTSTLESGQKVNSLEILPLLLGFIPCLLSRKIMAGAHLNMTVLSQTTSESRRAIKLGADQTKLNIQRQNGEDMQEKEAKLIFIERPLCNIYSVRSSLYTLYE